MSATVHCTTERTLYIPNVVYTRGRFRRVGIFELVFPSRYFRRVATSGETTTLSLATPRVKKSERRHNNTSRQFV